MTNQHKFNANQIYANPETYDAIVSLFNQIENLEKKKRFEWVDEELTETHNITFDFDEWFPVIKSYTIDFYNRFKYQIPESLNDDLVDYINQIKEYVDGFCLAPACLYEGKSFMVELYTADTFDEIVNHMKEVRQNHKMVFLYMVYKKPARPKETQIYEDELQKAFFRKEDFINYTIRYGVLNE